MSSQTRGISPSKLLGVTRGKNSSVFNFVKNWPGKREYGAKMRSYDESVGRLNGKNNQSNNTPDKYFGVLRLIPVNTGIKFPSGNIPPHCGAHAPPPSSFGAGDIGGFNEYLM